MIKEGRVFAFGTSQDILIESNIDVLYGITTQSVLLPHIGKIFLSYIFAMSTKYSSSISFVFTL